MDGRAGGKGCEDLREQEALFVRQAAGLLGRGLEPPVVLHEILHLLSELVGLNRGRIVLRDDDGRGVIRHAYGLRHDEIARGIYATGEGITGKVLGGGRTIIVQDINDDPDYLQRAVPRARLPTGTVSFIALPIAMGGRIVGVLGVHRLRERCRPLAADLQILNTAAAFIGQIIHASEMVPARAMCADAGNREAPATPGEAATAPPMHGIIGASQPLRAALARTDRVARSEASVLMLGESGTGKELFARALHLMSARRDGPFVRVNCGAIPENLFESELFGHERGAFTGAHATSIGRFEQAHGGTLFLDEIADIPLPLQVKLLRALQERVIERLGGRRAIAVDTRIVAATNEDLQESVRAGRFRLDLFYRLNVIPIRLPALRERPDDIPLLVDFHMRELSRAHGRVMRITPAALRRLAGYDWPGNIRQLRNVVERLVLLADTDLIEAREVEQALTGELAPAAPYAAPAGLVRAYGRVAEHDVEHIRNALRTARGNKSQAARLLGLTLRQFTYRLKRLGLEYVPPDC